VKVGNLYEKTVYSSCCNVTKGIYYYTTYENSQITGVRMHGVDLDAETLTNFPLVQGQQIRMEN
jgi:choloylglycine hydrolase